MASQESSYCQHELLLPVWFQELSQHPEAKPLNVQEWVDEEWRVKEGGFQGYDFCHSRQAAVRVVDYIMLPAGNGMTDAKQEKDVNVHSLGSEKGSTEQFFPRLVGVAYFSPRAESHRGLCHGGSFCALMDDIIGWLGFCTSGEVRPWSGYTVQVNTALRKPVKVGSVLRLEAWVDRKEGNRKYWIKSKLIDHDSGEVHCEGDGLFLASKEQAV